MKKDCMYALENEKLYVGFDSRGRIISLINKLTGSEMINYPGLEDNWKIMVLNGDDSEERRHHMDYIPGREQLPFKVETGGTSHQKHIIFKYSDLKKDDTVFEIDVSFIASISDENDGVEFTMEITNRQNFRIREAWYPIIFGFTGFQTDEGVNIVHMVKDNYDHRDVLRHGMPDAVYIFGVEEETYMAKYPYMTKMPWIDLHCGREGLYISAHDKTYTLTDTRIEKYPPEKGDISDYIRFPEDIQRWMRIMLGKLTAVDINETWKGEPNVISPHMGDWHTAAKIYRSWVDKNFVMATKSPKLYDYVGWQHLLGKTYLGEIYHTFDRTAKIAVEVSKRCGIDLVNFYGHEITGSEGDGFSMEPAEELGGRTGFKNMCDELHKHGVKVIVFNHRQSLLNMEDPNFPKYSDWTIKSRLGMPRTEVWWKTTIEAWSSLPTGTHYEANGPVSASICPHCDQWWETCLDEFKKLMELGLDGVQMDLVFDGPQICYGKNHGHKPGIKPVEKFMDRIQWLRNELKAINPEFLFCGEELPDCYSRFMDLAYSRYRHENGINIFRYTYPEVMENVAVDAYAYEQVNKSLYLGLGIDSEIWVLKKSLMDVPDFMDYIKAVTDLRRKYPELLINGRFIDTLKAMVIGNIRYSVFEDGSGGYAAVLWNNTDKQEECSLEFEEKGYNSCLVCIPGKSEKKDVLPLHTQIAPRTAIVVIAICG